MPVPKAIIFDMDGLLVDSEPFWKQTHISVFKDYGITVTEEQLKLTTGRKTIEVMKYWLQKFGKDTAFAEEAAEKNIDEMARIISEKAYPKVGVEYIVDFFAAKNLKLALASSSVQRLIDIVADKFSLRKKLNVICSAEFLPNGKPAPDVYLETAKLLKVEPEECLVFEDSTNGIKAAIAANMKCVWVPEDFGTGKYRQAGLAADLVIPSLFEFGEKEFESIFQNV